MFGIRISALEVFVVNSKASIQCVTLMPEHRTTLCFSGKSFQTSWVLLKWNKNSVCGPASGCQLSGVIFPLLSTGGQTGKLLPLFLPPPDFFLKFTLVWRMLAFCGMCACLRRALALSPVLYILGSYPDGA